MCTWLRNVSQPRVRMEGGYVSTDEEKKQNFKGALSSPAGSVLKRRNRPSLVSNRRTVLAGKDSLRRAYGRVLACCAPFCTGMMVTTGGSGGITLSCPVSVDSTSLLMESSSRFFGSPFSALLYPGLGRPPCASGDDSHPPVPSAVAPRSLPCRRTCFSMCRSLLR